MPETLKKTLAEVIAESQQVESRINSDRPVYEFIDDDDVMGLFLYPYSAEGKQFLFKDPKFRKPVTSNDLVALFLDHTAALTISADKKVVSKFGALGDELHTMMYTDERNRAHYYYSLGDYLPGELYIEVTGRRPKPASGAVVGTAIVGKDAVSGGSSPDPEPEEDDGGEVLEPVVKPTTEDNDDEGGGHELA